MNCPDRACRNQRGNVLFLILIAVVLFAALSYAVSSSNRVSPSSSVEALDSRISAIMSFVSSVRGAATVLRLRGCSEGQISFETPNLLPANYVNPNSPADQSCHFFSPSGADVSYIIPPADWLDVPCDALDGCGRWVFASAFRLPQIGLATNNDLVMYLPDVDKALCRRFNERVGLQNPSGAAPNDNFGGGGGTFIGGYTASAAQQIGDEHLPLAGLQEFCIQRTNGIAGNHFLFAVITPR